MAKEIELGGVKDDGPGLKRYRFPVEFETSMGHDAARKIAVHLAVVLADSGIGGSSWSVLADELQVRKYFWGSPLEDSASVEEVE